jgi:hypothetical protein
VCILYVVIEMFVYAESRKSEQLVGGGGEEE